MSVRKLTVQAVVEMLDNSCGTRSALNSTMAEYPAQKERSTKRIQ